MFEGFFLSCAHVLHASPANDAPCSSASQLTFLQLDLDLTMMMMKLLPLSLFLAGCIRLTASFALVPTNDRSSRLYLLEDEASSSWIGQPTTLDGATEESSLHKALEERREELKRGIGRRFVVRTQRGFLNVHSCMSKGPFCMDNIVQQLSDGDVITSKNIIGSWIQHEHGWSIARYQGFVFLEPVEE